MKRNFLPFILILIFLLSACQPAVLSEMETEEPDTAAFLPIDTSVPTESPSVEPTQTETPIPAPSVTSTPALTFTLFSAERRVDGYSLGFTAPGVTTNYRLVADGKNFTCSTDMNVPDRLFCYGPNLPTDNYFFIQFYEPETGDLVYESETIIPYAIFAPTMPVGDLSTWCPQRGENVTCESETVWSREPIPCYASTCYDACGYFYSIDTCVPGT